MLAFILFFVSIFSIYSEETSSKNFFNSVLKHPEIQALESYQKSLKGNSVHEETYPDPKVGIAFRNYPVRSYSFNDKPLDTPSMTGIEYSVSQEIPYPGKLGLKGKLGKLGEKESGYYLQSNKNKFLLEFLNTLISKQTLQRKLEILKDIKLNLESQKKIQSASSTSGSGNLAKSLKTQSAINSIYDKELETQREIKNLDASIQYYSKSLEKSDLNQFSLNSFLRKSESNITQSIDDKKQRLIENPNYKLLLASVDKSKTEQELSDIEHAPEAEIFFAYMRRRNQDFQIDRGPLNYQIMDTTEYRGDLFSVGVNMKIPVWSFLTKKGLHERSSENTKSKNFDLEKIKLSLEADLEKLLNTINGINEQLELHNKRIIPDLEKAISAESSLYSTGKIEFSEILSTKNDLLIIHLTAEDLLEKKYKAVLSILELTDSFLE